MCPWENCGASSHAYPFLLVAFITLISDCVRFLFERLVVPQGVKHFKDIQYTPSLTYGELLLQNEYEMSCYNMDQADVAIQQQMFKLHEEVWPPFPWTADQAPPRLLAVPLA